MLIGVVLFLAISVAVLLRGVQQATQPVIELQQEVSTEVARLLHPTPTIIPDPVTIIHEVQSLARLETIQYSVEKVITAETRQGPFGFLFGDRLLLVAHGPVSASSVNEGGSGRFLCSGNELTLLTQGLPPLLWHRVMGE